MSKEEERVFILMTSELERLIAYKQSEALRTIYGIAKENPKASWNELIISSIKKLQDPEPITNPTEFPTVGEAETLTEENVEEELNIDGISEVEEAADLVEETEEVEDEVLEEEALGEESPEEETDGEELTEEEELEAARTAEQRRVSSFRENDGSVVKSASIFDD